MSFSKQYSGQEVVDRLRREDYSFLFAKAENGITHCRACVGPVPDKDMHSHIKRHELAQDGTVDTLCLLCCRNGTNASGNSANMAAHVDGKAHQGALQKLENGKVCHTCAAYVPRGAKHSSSHKTAKPVPLCKEGKKQVAETKKVAQLFAATTANSKSKSIRPGQLVKVKDAMASLFLVAGKVEHDRIESTPLCMAHVEMITGYQAFMVLPTMQRAIADGNCRACSTMEAAGLPQYQEPAFVWSIARGEVPHPKTTRILTLEEYARECQKHGFDAADYKIKGGVVVYTPKDEVTACPDEVDGQDLEEAIAALNVPGAAGGPAPAAMIRQDSSLGDESEDEDGGLSANAEENANV